jgi:unsaturated rhamnogalacturonyl hydrolase
MTSGGARAVASWQGTGPRRGTLLASLAVAALQALPIAVGAQAAPTDPLALARLLAERYPQSASVSYIPALSWGGALRLGELTGEGAWRERARTHMQPLFDEDLPTFGAPYSLTRVGGFAAVADLGRVEADGFATARARAAAELILPDPGSSDVRFATGWTDDMFMATSLLTRVGASGDERFLAPVESLLTEYARRLQRPDGLFVHAEEAPHAWGRGNGFAALGLVEGLAQVPEGWPGRREILDAYRRQMRAFVRHQSGDGSWRQVVDHPESYQELSVTAMVVAAMARGVRLGWLEADAFTPVIERGWSAVTSRVGADGSVRDVCTSTGAGPTLEYYMARPTVNGMDDRGGGLVLLAALEMAELARGVRMR